jgi:hypothetical protein
MEPFSWDHGALFHKQPYPKCLSQIRKASPWDWPGTQRDSQASMPKLGLYSAVAKPRSEPAIVGLLSFGTEQMPLDEPFPLDLFSPRVRTVIRNEFNGRCPTQQEVAEIPDARWLATPEIGPVLLKRIRNLGQDRRPPVGQLTNAELLRRLTDLQQDLELIRATVRMWAHRKRKSGIPSARRWNTDSQNLIG